MALKEDILNIIGLETSSDYLDSTEIADIYPIMSDAVYRAVCSLPAKLMLENCAVTMDVENLVDNIPGNDPFPEASIPDDGFELNDGDIILAVERTASSSALNTGGAWVENYTTRFAKEIVSTQRLQSLDSESIYFATDYSPVYWIETSGTTPAKKKIFTAPSSAASKNTINNANYLNTHASAIRVWYYPKQTLTSAHTIFSYTPNYIKEFLLKVCAVALINTKIASQATEEEDSELMQLLGNVKAIFEEDCKNQLLNYQEKYK